MIWFADAILIVALVLLGRRGWHKLGWFLSASGNGLWAVGAAARGSKADILVIPVIFMFIAGYNFFRVGRDE